MIEPQNMDKKKSASVIFVGHARRINESLWLSLSCQTVVCALRSMHTPRRDDHDIVHADTVSRLLLAIEHVTLTSLPNRPRRNSPCP